MADLAWLSKEAHNFHEIFINAFYTIITIFIILGVIIELLKVPMEGQVAVTTLIGRAFIAVFLLYTFSDFLNLLSDLTDGLTNVLGAQNNFDLIRQKMADKWKKEFSWSWIEITKTITMLISYIAFVLFHLSFYIANAFILFTWTILYVFSPVLISLFVLPQTARATSALYRSLLEVACWKPVWSVLATLLWSIGLGDIATTSGTSSVLTVFSYTLVFAGALILTPLIVHALAGAGISGLLSSLSAPGLGIATFDMARISKWLGRGSETSKLVYNTGHSAAARATEKYFPKVHRYIKAAPKFSVPNGAPLFEPKIDPKKANKKTPPSKRK